MLQHRRSVVGEPLSRCRLGARAYSLRPARPSDAPALSALALRSKQSWGYSEAFMKACRKELTYSAEQISSTAFTFVVAESAGTCAGFYALAHATPEACELEALFVDPDHHGRGIGLTLLRDSAERAAGVSARVLVVQSDPNAAGFYRSAGFTDRGMRISKSIGGRFLPLLALDLTQPGRRTTHPDYFS